MFETRLTADRIAQYERAGYWGRGLLWDDVAAVASADPERTAVWDRRGTYTYQQLTRAADRVAVGLLEHGVRTGDIVSVQLPNRGEFVVLLLALERIGVVMNPIVPSLRQRELRTVLSIGRARALVVPDEVRGFEHARAALELKKELPDLREIVVFGPDCPAGALPWDELGGEKQLDPGMLVDLRPDADDVTELDDPEVHELASTFGDPDEILREDWVPSIPGISAPGDYADYAGDPARFIYGPPEETTAAQPPT